MVSYRLTQPPAASDMASTPNTLSRAKTLRQQKRFDEASTLLLAALGSEVSADKIFFELGNVYVDAGDLARAEYSYTRATEENPHHSSALHNLGAIYKRQGKHADAVKMQRRALQADLRSTRAEQRLPPDVVAWARRLALHGFAALIVFFTLALLLLYWLQG